RSSGARHPCAARRPRRPTPVAWFEARPWTSLVSSSGQTDVPPFGQLTSTSGCVKRGEDLADLRLQRCAFGLASAVFPRDVPQCSCLLRSRERLSAGDGSFGSCSRPSSGGRPSCWSGCPASRRRRSCARSPRTAAAGFTVIGAANPLDDVGTARLSRGLADRFLLLPLDYQPRDEEIEIVRRRCGTTRAGFHPFAVDVARESRGHPDLRHGASVRGAIDMVDLLAGWAGDELDLETLRYLGCTAYGGKLRVRPAARRPPLEIVDELIDP